MDLAWLWVVPVLGILIIVHEMGHFFTAIWLGIKVEEFGIGFPPRMFAIRRKGIDYSMNWLPIGGFVKIVGENGDSDDPNSFGKAAAWKRIIVLAAGSAMNLLLALLIFAGMAISGTREIDTAQAPYTGIAGVNNPSPAFTAGIKPGDKIVSIAGTPVNSDDEIRTLSNQNGGKPTEYVVLRDGQQVPLTVTPNTTSPYLGVNLFAWYSPAVVDSVRDNGIAATAGLRNGDVIVAVNGNPVSNNISAETYIAEGIKTSKPVELSIERGGVASTITIPGGTPRFDFGVYEPIRTVYYTPWEAMGRALKSTWDVIASIPTGIAQAFSSGAQGAGVTSIVGIGQLTGEVAQEAGINGLLNLTALLGISLFMINLLPLPALDGGRLLFIFVELLRGGRRIAPEKEGMVHFAGMVVLLALMAIITFFDVSRLFQGVRLLP